MIDLPEDALSYWAFCNEPEVVELLSQLNRGLIHPIEYANKIFVLATKLQRRESCVE